METLLEALAGLVIVVGLGLAAREAEQAEEAPALVPIPVKSGRRGQ